MSDIGHVQNEFKIILRLPNEQDFNLMIEIEMNPENLKYTSLEKPEIYQIRAFLASEHSLRLHNQIRFVIELNLQAIGFIDLYEANFHKHEAFVGVIVKEEYRCKGFASQALIQLKSFASKQGIYRLHAEIGQENEASLRFFMNNGFEWQSQKDQSTILTLSIE